MTQMNKNKHFLGNLVFSRNVHRDIYEVFFDEKV